MDTSRIVKRSALEIQARYDRLLHTKFHGEEALRLELAAKFSFNQARAVGLFGFAIGLFVGWLLCIITQG
jgi:hypothetical protein